MHSECIFFLDILIRMDKVWSLSPQEYNSGAWCICEDRFEKTIEKIHVLCMSLRKFACLRMSKKYKALHASNCKISVSTSTVRAICLRIFQDINQLSVQKCCNVLKCCQTFTMITPVFFVLIWRRIFFEKNNM